MTVRNSQPVPFTPLGVTDAVDALFPGSCLNLQNLVFDRVNRGAVVPRPGVVQATAFPGFNTPGVVSAALAVGTRIYGLIATARNPGYDEPFCYDTATNAFVTVSGVLAGNVPATPSTSGAWTPPTMDVVGTKVVVTHPGFSGSNYIGVFDLTNPAAPAWDAGNTTTTALPSIPLWVRQFYGRAYYGVGNQVMMSDPLAATVIGTTSAANTLTLGDSASSTAGVGLPLNTSSGGILGSLIVFKPNAIFQITGDPAGSNTLALNTLASNIGCVAPRTAVSTPAGIMFIATDGPRIVDLSGNVGYPQQNDAQGCDLVSPFAQATNPSRMCAAFNNATYRVAFDAPLNVWNAVYTSADYWFDSMFGRWNGAHTFAYHVAVPVGSTFYLASNSTPGALFKSDAVPNSTTVYTDNGSAFTCNVTSSALTGSAMSESALVESTIELCSQATDTSYYLTVFDDQNNPLSVATISIKTPTPLWGTAKFGQFQWRNSQSSSHAYQIPWVNPIVFNKAIFQALVTAAQFVSIKSSSHRVQALRYVKT